MIDDVMSASLKRSPTPSVDVLTRIEQFVEQNPNCTTWFVETEEAAAEILTALAATLHTIAQEMPEESEQRLEYLQIAEVYRCKVIMGKSHEYLLSLDREDRPEIHGMVVEAIEPTRIIV